MEHVIDYKGVKERIIKAKARNILLQLPDGLKPDFKEVIMNLKGDYNLFLWAGTCFGACDLPLFAEQAGIDLIIHFGHEKWD